MAIALTVAVAAGVIAHGSGQSGRADYTVLPQNPVAHTSTTFDGSRSSCDQKPCAYRWTATVLRSTRAGGKRVAVVLTATTSGGRPTPVLGRRRIFRYAFPSAGSYLVKLTVFDRSGRHFSRVERIVVSGPASISLDPNFVGPSYYSRFSHGPSSSMDFFPIYTYQLNLGQWSELPARIAAMGVNGVDDAYGQPVSGDYRLGLAHGLRFNLMGKLPSADPAAVTSYAMQDEPNQTSSPYAATSCSGTSDTCAQAYVAAANAYRGGDRSRPVWGNFTKDADEWTPLPNGWTDAQYARHETAMLGSLDIASADFYGWTDSYEWDQAGGQGSGHYGAWVYGHTVERLHYYNPHIPAYGFVECCDSTNGNGTTKPTNEMMPGMLQAAIWNILVHGGRGYVFWTTNFWDSSKGGDPYADPYAGATYQGNFALYGEHQWDAQYAGAQQVNHEVKSFAPDLNSPTVLGISAISSSGVPVATLGKQVGGRLWLLAQADGDLRFPLSNTSPMTATITLPSAVPIGAVLKVVGESRTVTVNASRQITDTFATTTETPFSGRPITYGYQHHVYAMG